MLKRTLFGLVASLIVTCVTAPAQRQMSAAEVRRHNEMVLRLKKQSKWNSGVAPSEPARPVFMAPDGRQYIPPVEKVSVLLISKTATVVRRQNGTRYRVHYRSPDGTLDLLPGDTPLIHSPGPFGGKGSALFLSRAFQRADIVKTERLR